MVKIFSLPTRRSTRHGAQAEAELQWNTNALSERQATRGSATLGQSPSPCWGEENQERPPKEGVSALDLNLAQQRVLGEWSGDPLSSRGRPQLGRPVLTWLWLRPGLLSAGGLDSQNSRCAESEWNLGTQVEGRNLVL